jgi:sporulation protein YlmC with PRC-barrel domain
MMRTVNLEHLAGRRVFSQRGKSIGHIEEILAEQRGDELVVTEFHVGIYAAFERLSASTIGIAMLDLFLLRRREGLYRIPWDKLDISDPARPRLLCPMTELSGWKGQKEFRE